MMTFDDAIDDLYVIMLPYFRSQLDFTPQLKKNAQIKKSYFFVKSCLFDHYLGLRFSFHLDHVIMPRVVKL